MTTDYTGQTSPADGSPASHPVRNSLGGTWAALRTRRDDETEVDMQMCMDFSNVMEILGSCKFPTSWNDADLLCDYDRFYTHGARES